jgi:hypothetical protein
VSRLLLDSRCGYAHEFTRTSGDEWVTKLIDKNDNNKEASSKFRSISESCTEIIMFDSRRNIYVRMDLVARKELSRQGTTGNWLPLLDILAGDCL